MEYSFLCMLPEPDGKGVVIPAVDDLLDYHHDVAAGVVVLDAYIANPDRAPEDMLVIAAEGGTRLRVFNHERSLFGTAVGMGDTRLIENLDVVSLDGSGNALQHPLLDAIYDAGLLNKWCLRLLESPTWLIEEIVTDAVTYGGVSMHEGEMLDEFLSLRRSALPKMLHDLRRRIWLFT